MPRATNCLAGSVVLSIASTPLMNELNEDAAKSCVVEVTVSVVLAATGSPHVYRGANVSVVALVVATMTGLAGSEVISTLSGPIWMVAVVIAVLARLMTMDASEKVVKGVVVPAVQFTDNTA